MALENPDSSPLDITTDFWVFPLIQNMSCQDHFRKLKMEAMYLKFGKKKSLNSKR